MTEQPIAPRCNAMGFCDLDRGHSGDHSGSLTSIAVSYGAAVNADLAERFARWASDAGILARVSEGECRDLAAAYMAGYMHGQQS